MKILITGGAGFIGSHIAEHFQGKAEIRILDNLRTGYRHNLRGLDVEFIEGSILDEALVRRAVQGVDYVFHLAALVSVPESMSRPQESVDLNVTGLLNVLNASAEAGVTKLVLASSAAIYGNNPAVPKREDMLPEPLSPYAVTKLDGEYYCDLFTRTRGLETACLRFFNVFGPRQDPNSAYAAAVPIFMRKALANEPIVIFGDGEQTRDFIYVKDIVAANVFVATTPGVTGVFNVGYGGSQTVNHVAQSIITAAGSSSVIRHEPERAGDVKHSRASVDRLHSAGFRPVSNLEEGFAATLAYFRAKNAQPSRAIDIEEVRHVARQFPLAGTLLSAERYGSGHINDTVCVAFDQAGVPVRYIFQRINDLIFKDVPLLMENIHRVTSHLVSKQTGDDSRQALTLVSTRDGKPLYRTPEGRYWRVYLFIEKSRTYDKLENAEQAFQAARAFGAFQAALADLPGTLEETIPNFHHTPKRFERLEAAIAADSHGRAAGVREEIAFALGFKNHVSRLVDLLAAGAMPLRTTHNDTKINNVMLDDATGQGICVIDLDTVMPGLSLYDFGDMVRTAVSPAAEDETDLSLIEVRRPVFEALIKGFVEGAGSILTPAEWDNLVFAGKLMTFEVGIRFLTDYLEGDVYFRTSRPGHNLDRCRTQFRLVECLEKDTPDLEAIVSRYRVAP